ncbi:MAG TPA: hypothetical protein VJ577_11440 [Burkholderiaceae bacterium]|nr:hypothetical protein [Burkholderiaceae bacterium]
MNKLSALWALFRQGEEVVDPAKWKRHQVTATVLGALILAAIKVIKAFGYDIPIDQAAANDIGIGVLAVVNVVLTITTSKRAGLPARDDLPPTAGTDPDAGKDYIG